MKNKKLSKSLFSFVLCTLTIIMSVTTPSALSNHIFEKSGNLPQFFLRFALVTLLAAAILIVVILLIKRLIKKICRSISNAGTFAVSGLINELTKRETSSKSDDNGFSQNAVPMDYTGTIIPAVRRVDPDFMGEVFLSWACSVFLTFQKAWCSRDLSKLQALEKSELFEKHRLLINEDIKTNKYMVVENIRICKSYLHKYERDSMYEYLTVYVAIVSRSRVINDKTGDVINGTVSSDNNESYLLTFMRKNGVKTNNNTDKISAKSCPSCGAPLSIANSGRCDYCGCIITTGDFDWVLSNIDMIRPGIFIDNRGVIINDSKYERDSNVRYS